MNMNHLRYRLDLLMYAIPDFVFSFRELPPRYSFRGPRSTRGSAGACWLNARCPGNACVHRKKTRRAFMFSLNSPLAIDVAINAKPTRRRSGAVVNQSFPSDCGNRVRLNKSVEDDGIQGDGQPELPPIFILQRLGVAAIRRRTPASCCAAAINGGQPAASADPGGS
jgi:hypothetical protein